jgi:hypothetical protein
MLDPLLEQLATPPPQQPYSVPEDVLQTLGDLANRPLLPIASLLWEQCDRGVKCGFRPLFGHKLRAATGQFSAQISSSRENFGVQQSRN